MLEDGASGKTMFVSQLISRKKKKIQLMLRVRKGSLSHPPSLSELISLIPRLSPANYLAFWSTLCMQSQIICLEFRKQHCVLQINHFILMRSNGLFVCFWGGHSILYPGKAWKQLKSLLISTQPNKFNFFFFPGCLLQFIHGFDSVSSLSSVIGSAFSSVSFTC